MLLQCVCVCVGVFNPHTLTLHCSSPHSSVFLPAFLPHPPRLNYLLAGGHYPVGFHVPNVVLHAVISALMMDVFAVLIGGLSHAGGSGGGGGVQNLAPRASLLAALMFAAHPVHTESVSPVGAGCVVCDRFAVCEHTIHYTHKMVPPNRPSGVVTVVVQNVLCG